MRARTVIQKEQFTITVYSRAVCCITLGANIDTFCLSIEPFDGNIEANRIHCA